MDKKDGDPNLDVAMGSYDGTEICRLVGLYILHVLGEKYGKDKAGLYLDDGSACFGNINESQAEISSFQYLKLNINIALHVKRIWWMWTF